MECLSIEAEEFDAAEPIGNDMALSDRVTQLEQNQKKLVEGVAELKDGLAKATGSDNATSAIPQTEVRKNWIPRNLFWLVPLVIGMATIGTNIAIPYFQGRAKHEQGDLDSAISKAVSDGLKPLGDKISGLDGRMLAQEAVAKQLQDNIKLLLEKVIKAAASLPSDQFRRTLDTTATQLSIAASLHAPADSDTSKQLQEHLSATDPSTPFFWSAAGAFVSYKSTASKPDVQVLFAPWNGKCGELTEERQLTVRRTGAKFNAKNLSYLHCEATLDDQMVIENVTLEECVVIYHGGDVKFKNVRFVNCIFVFDFTRTPQGDGQRLARQLVAASSLAEVRIG